LAFPAAREAGESAEKLSDTVKIIIVEEGEDGFAGPVNHLSY